MSDFTSEELDYLQSDKIRLGRLATVGPDGMPHVVPVGFSLSDRAAGIVVTGHNFAETKKFRDVERSGVASIVIDDFASTDPWRPRGIEVRGRAEAIDGQQPLIKIHPHRIVSWGINPGGSSARTVKQETNKTK